jgi:hypothetical protein
MTAEQKTRPTGEVNNNPIEENGGIPKTIYGFLDYGWSCYLAMGELVCI